MQSHVMRSLTAETVHITPDTVAAPNPMRQFHVRYSTKSVVSDLKLHVKLPSRTMLIDIFLDSLFILIPMPTY